MSEMVERVAWEVCRVTAGRSLADHSVCREVARAVIAAMREPTEAMEDAARETLMGNPLAYAIDAWEAMIDEDQK